MPQNRTKPLVLMVDDDPDFQAIIRDWVSPRFEHLGLLNGDDLEEELAASDPDIIILDVRMPGPDGFSICRMIRSDRRFLHIPILFLTGCKEDEDFMKNLEVGGTAYLTKPIARRQLLSALRELMLEQSTP